MRIGMRVGVGIGLLMLSVFLLGIALGGALFGKLADRSRRPYRLLGMMLAAIGLIILAEAATINYLPSLFLRLLVTFGEQRTRRWPSFRPITTTDSAGVVMRALAPRRPSCPRNPPLPTAGQQKRRRRQAPQAQVPGQHHARTVTGRRDSPCGGFEESAAPHALQYRARSGFFAPQLEHSCTVTSLGRLPRQRQPTRARRAPVAGRCPGWDSNPHALSGRRV